MSETESQGQTETQKPVASSELFGGFWRVWGKAYPVRDIVETQARHGRRGAHIEAEWTTPEHWAHNNYERSHLPQLCVRASGWKARIIAAMLWPKRPWQWWK